MSQMLFETAFLESESLQGHAFLVLWRNTPQSRTDACPYCRKRHLHTPEDGHRSSHCPLSENKKLTLPHGITVHAFDGYIIKSRTLVQTEARTRDRG